MNKNNKSIKELIATIRLSIALAWKASRIYTILQIVITIGEPLLLLSISFIEKNTLDFLAGTIRTNNPGKTLLFLLATSFLLGILHLVCRNIRTFLYTIHSELIQKHVVLHIMKSSETADLAYFDDPEYYNKLRLCTQEASTISQLLWNTLSCINSFVSLVSAFLVIYRVNICYSFAMISIALPACVFSITQKKALYGLDLQHINGERQKGYIQQLISNKTYIPLLRLYNAFSYLQEKYITLWNKLFIKRKHVLKKQSIIYVLLSCCPEIMMCIIGFHLAILVINGTKTIGDYSLYTGMISQLYSSTHLFSNAVAQIYDKQLKVQNFYALSSYSAQIKDLGTRSLNAIHSIIFENVNFSYPNCQSATLTNVSFSISSAQKAAIVGLNGSGKSTVVKLLLRLYEADSGTIKINNIDISEYRLNDLRRCFSVYFQNDPCFSFTLRENITISDLSSSSGDTSLKEFFTIGCAESILDKAPLGLNTYLTRLFDQNGLELSGGEYQKVALVRSLYRQHSVLILDEPTANLDPQSEHNLLSSILQIEHSNIFLLISHRLSNLKNFDNIIVMEHGQVIETGSEQELLDKKGRYAELKSYQQKDFNTDSKHS